MTSRYQISDPVMLYQQQKSHYQRLYNPRTTLKMNAPHRKIHSLYHNTKTTNEKNRLRKIQNKKMLLTLLDIYNNKPGILAKQYDTFGLDIQQKRKGSNCSYKKQWQEKEIKKENHELFQSLVKVEPLVGNKKEWNKHFQQHRENQKKLMQHQNKEMFNLKQYKQSFTREKQRKLMKLDKKQQKLINQIEHNQVVSKKEQRKKKKKKIAKNNQQEQKKEDGKDGQLMQTVPV